MAEPHAVSGGRARRFLRLGVSRVGARLLHTEDSVAGAEDIAGRRRSRESCAPPHARSAWVYCTMTQDLFPETASVDFAERAVSPRRELGAYEALWARDGTWSQSPAVSAFCYSMARGLSATVGNPRSGSHSAEW